MGRMDTELAKLALMAEGGKVDGELVGNTVTFQRERQMWDMTNELACRPGRRGDSSLASAFADGSLRRISRHHLAGHVAGKRPQGPVDETERPERCRDRSALRIWPRDNQGPFLKTAAAMGSAGVARAIDLLVTADYHSKSGVGDFATNVESFLLAIASQQPRRA